MKIILVRHGETIENKNRIIQGDMPGVLSELGVSQAKRIADRLKEEKIDYIYSSDLARSADTAKEIVKFHPDVPVEFIEELRERGMGDLKGKGAPENWSANLWNLETAERYGLEMPEEVVNRAKNFIGRINGFNGTILLVGHMGVNQAIELAFFGKSWRELEGMNAQKNNIIIVMEFNEDGNLKKELINCEESLK